MFEFWALPHQLPPEGNWTTWVALGGQGAGKTRAGAEWVRTQVEGARPLDEGMCRQFALVGETYDQVRDVMVFGESGILSCCPPDRRPKWEATRRRLVWPNGGVATCYSASDPECLRGPQFDADWVDEFGCPAIDKGTNQPNVFLEEKSSESFAPYYSNGSQDSYLQRQYLAAMHEYWGDEAHNPISSFYDGPMIDMTRSSVWAWDTRPWPDFPDRLSLWSDGVNYKTGHWVSGRFADQSLASVVAEVCEISNVFHYDVSALRGSVTGFAIRDVETGRQSLQSLMIAYDFISFEDRGKLVFAPRSQEDAMHFPEADLALLSDQDDVVSKTRSPDAERVGRLRVQFWDQNAHYEAASVEARFTGDTSQATSSMQLPLVLERGAGQVIANRMFANAKVARDEVKIALPPSNLEIALGDYVSIGDSPFTYRVDRIDDYGSRIVEAVRVERGVFDAVTGSAFSREPQPVLPETTPHNAFLDLPLLKGNEIPHAPHFAATATPWGKGVAIYSSSSQEGYSLNTIVETPAVFGQTLSVLGKSEPARWDRGVGVLVRFSNDVQPRTHLDVLNGANAGAIRFEQGDWEVFQFSGADLQSDGSYRLHGLLRGQAGTEWVMPNEWPIGSEIVILDAGVEQLDIAETARGLERNYRVGPASKSVLDQGYIQSSETFEGVGLRPYAPAHFRAVKDGVGGVSVNWVRRTRIDGDSWQSFEVPLGEDMERYHLRVWNGAELLREAETTEPAWNYTAGEITTDGASGTVDIEVAQLSGRFGIGPYNRMTVNV